MLNLILLNGRSTILVRALHIEMIFKVLNFNFPAVYWVMSDCRALNFTLLHQVLAEFRGVPQWIWQVAEMLRFLDFINSIKIAYHRRTNSNMKTTFFKKIFLSFLYYKVVWIYIWSKSWSKRVDQRGCSF